MDIAETVDANQCREILRGSICRETSSEVHPLNSHLLEIKFSWEKVISYACRLLLSVSKSRQHRHLHLHIFKIRMHGVKQDFYLMWIFMWCAHSGVSKWQWISARKWCQLGVRYCCDREVSFTLTVSSLLPVSLILLQPQSRVFHKNIAPRAITSCPSIPLKPKKRKMSSKFNENRSTWKLTVFSCVWYERFEQLAPPPRKRVTAAPACETLPVLFILFVLIVFRLLLTVTCEKFKSKVEICFEEFTICINVLCTFEINNIYWALKRNKQKKTNVDLFPNCAQLFLGCAFQCLDVFSFSCSVSLPGKSYIDYILLSWANITLAPEFKSKPPLMLFSGATGHSSLCKLL